MRLRSYIILKRKLCHKGNVKCYNEHSWELSEHRGVGETAHSCLSCWGIVT